MLLTRGNHKLSRTIGIWTLPAGLTCIGAGECLKWCYSRKTEKWDTVHKSRLKKLEVSKKEDFVELIVNEIKRRKFLTIRVHQDGDFYSQPYVDKWIEIVKQLPDIIFFAYTKSFSQLDFSKLPDNFILFQSYGSRFDEKIDITQNTARVINEVSEKRDNEYLCPYHDKEHFKACGETCSVCMTKEGKIKHIAFLKH